MTTKPSRQSEVLAIIQRHGPITTAGISHHMDMSKSGVNLHLKNMEGELAHIAEWESTLSSAHQVRWSAKWQAGPGENVPMPKGLPCQERAHVVVDLSKMPYRSVFAGGVSPWAAMEQSA